MVRFDTYIDEQPPHRLWDDAKARKKELVDDGWRVKIRKDADGLFVIHKKHDELFHSQNTKRTRRDS